MSRDIQLAFPCSHILGEERVTLDPDRRSLYTIKPINGTSLLKLVVNDTYEVPAFTGVVTSATLRSYRREPYRVTTATNSITVTTTTRTFTVSLPTGYLSNERLTSLFTAAQGSDVQVGASVGNGCFTLTDQKTMGLSSRMQVTGTALEPLGFDQQSGDKGKVVVPSWKVYARSAGLGSAQDIAEADPRGYFIRFDAPVRQNYYYSVTYTVPPDQCLRCRGTEVENDYRFDTQGEAITVTDENLLYQSCLKVILTELGSNIYYPWYGSNLADLIGSKAIGGTASGIRQSVMNALTRFQNLQNAQAKFQRITAKERLFSVDGVVVTPSSEDPTVFLVEVNVRNFSSDPVVISIVYTAPGMFALPGTNNLSLGNF